MIQRDLDKAVNEIREERENKKDVINFKDGLSIDETRTSSLVISFLITLVFSLVMYVIDGDISPSLTNIIIAFIAAIGGVNAVDKFKSSNNARKF